MSNNRRKIEKCLAGGENHVTVHTGVNSKDIATLNGTRKRRAIDNGTKED